MEIDEMFGSFNPTAPKQNNESGSKKRRAETNIDELEKSVKNNKKFDQEEVIDLEADVEYDGG